MTTNNRPSAPLPLHSASLTKGIQRATHRSLFYSMGWLPENLNKPLVAVVNSFNELIAGHVHLQPLCQAIKLGIAEAGGTPLEFPSIAVCDGLATGMDGMRMPMPSRELIADSIELMITAHALDAMVLLTNCDKITPGMLMAAARLNIPAIVVTGGPMDTGCFRGRKACYTDLIEAEAAVTRGRDERAKSWTSSSIRPNPGAGSCAMMGTANTMNILTEALGMTLTDRRADSQPLRRAGRPGAGVGARHHGAAPAGHPAARHHDAGGVRECPRRGHGDRRLHQHHAAPARHRPRGGPLADLGRFYPRGRADAAPGAAQARGPATLPATCTTPAAFPR